MRDPARIPEVLKILQETWEMLPDWRLGQLIFNVARDGGHRDSFYIEDDKLVKGLQELVLRLEQPSINFVGDVSNSLVNMGPFHISD